MAKTQNLSLNPTKISGTCGRLMCCLKYEQDAYEDLLRTAPKAESFVDTPEGRGTVVEIDLLRQRVKVKLEDQPEVIHTFANSDIAVLRSGKAKKNDPPIPADLAPISGGGKRIKKEEKDDDRPVFLDSIKLKYSEETIAEETSAEEEIPQEEEAPTPKQGGNRRHKSRRGKPSQGEKPAQQKAEKPAPQKAEQPAGQKQENGEGKKSENNEGKKSNNRRHYHRHRRGGKPSGDKKPQE
jgi:hypothetical protein